MQFNNSTQSKKPDSMSEYLHLPCQPQVQKLLCAQVPFVQVRILQKTEVKLYMSFPLKISSHALISQNAVPWKKKSTTKIIE